MEFISYTEQLKNPKWQKKRLEILQRDNFTCQYCNDTNSQLNVHHLIYETKYAWEADNAILITLCDKCHKRYHDVYKDVEPKILNSLKKKLKDPFIIKCAVELFSDFKNLNDLIYCLWELRDREKEVLKNLCEIESSYDLKTKV